VNFAALAALVLFAISAFAQTDRGGDPLGGQISFGLDGQNYSSGRMSNIGSIDATLRLSPRLALEALTNGGSYFGEGFGGGGGFITVKPLGKTYLTVGGTKNTNTATTFTWSTSLEAGTVVYRCRTGTPVHRCRTAVGGLEADFNATLREYHLTSSAGVLGLTPRIVIYFPRDWTLTLRGGALRATIGGLSDWTPSGGVSVNVPVTRRLILSPGVNLDSEPADILQIKNISSRQFGSGVRFWLTERTSLGGYYFRVLYGANRLTADSYGASYTLRF
jgi:hypothetical protein